MTEASYVSWSRGIFNALTIGGIWGVPRSGLIFTRQNENTLALTAVMPWEKGMPLTARQLHDQQVGDYMEIARYMKKAGVTVYDQTEIIDPDE